MPITRWDTGQPFGAHQRYWIKSKENQILGAILFAAPAKALADRDAWIGWTPLDRRRFLHRIVSNSRFLILPGVRVPHLASHVLALATRRLRTDWQERYGYAPALWRPSSRRRTGGPATGRPTGVTSARPAAQTSVIRRNEGMFPSR